MKTLNDLTREEISLLLYLETLCVDYTGRIDNRRLVDS